VSVSSEQSSAVWYSLHGGRAAIMVRIKTSRRRTSISCYKGCNGRQDYRMHSYLCERCGSVGNCTAIWCNSTVPSGWALHCVQYYCLSTCTCTNLRVTRLFVVPSRKWDSDSTRITVHSHSSRNTRTKRLAFNRNRYSGKSWTP
jgi:hypothetical protein